jgi:sulfofructose kinase
MTFDVLGFGAVALDEVLYVNEFPPADTKVRVQSFDQECGGLTGNALVAAARFGAKCAYAGRLGLSPEARQIDESFRAEGVDTSHASRREEDGVVRSTIVVGTDSGTRNVFSRRTGLTGARDGEPPEDVVRSARVILMDHHGSSGGVRIARIAAAAGIPVVGDFERLDAPMLDELLQWTTHLIVPEAFACALTRASSPGAAAEELAKAGRQVTIVTAGTNGCWVANPSAATHHRAFSVPTVDTAGCGDVFHGIYAATLAAGMSLPERIRFASAAAALKASRRGLQKAIPRKAEIEAFLAAFPQ